MRKRVRGAKLSRSRTARDAMYRSLLKALVSHGEITTTKAKAKAVQRYTEKLASTAKKGGLSDRRRVLGKLANDKDTTSALFERVSVSDRTSGYTRILLLNTRRGDNTQMAKIGWVDELKAEKTKGKKNKAKTKK